MAHAVCRGAGCAELLISAGRFRAIVATAIVAVAAVGGSVSSSFGGDGKGGPAALAGSEWGPVELGGEIVPANADIFVQFGAGGKVAGNGGCNRFNGSYTAETARIRIGPLMSTRRGCETDVMTRETAFFAGLEKAKLFLRNGTKLTLKNAQGVTTLRLIQRDWD